MPSRAHDNGMFLIFSNGVGIDGDEVRTGNAMIFNPSGEILAETWAADDKMIVADLKAEQLPMNIGMRWIQTRRPDLYGSLSKPTGRELDTRTVRFKGIEKGGDRPLGQVLGYLDILTNALHSPLLWDGCVT